MNEPGLCRDCKHAQRIQTARSTFWLCARGLAEPERYARYPRLPVLRCAGHESA